MRSLFIDKASCIFLVFVACIILVSLVYADGMYVPPRHPPQRTIEFRGTAWINGTAVANGTNVTVWGNNGTLLMDTAVAGYGNGFYDHLEIIWDDNDTHVDDPNCTTYLPPPNSTCRICTPGSCDEGITFDDSSYEHITFKINSTPVDIPYYLTFNTSSEGAVLYQDLFIGNVTEVNCSVTFTLASDNRSIFVNWSSQPTPDSFSIYYSDNASYIYNLNVSSATANVTGLTGNNWTDTNASILYPHRYYAVAGIVSGSASKCVQMGCMFNIEIVTAPGSPGQVEGNLISFPCIPDNLSMENIVRFPTANDRIYIYNVSVAPPTYQSVKYFGTPINAWSGPFTLLEIEKGFWFSPVGAGYNLSIVGQLPVDNLTLLVKAAPGSPGQIEGNQLPWNTVKTVCNFSTIIPSPTANDRIYIYNVSVAPPTYQSVKYFGAPIDAWSGPFDCIEPGRGYWFSPVGTEYNWTYNRTVS